MGKWLDSIEEMMGYSFRVSLEEAIATFCEIMGICMIIFEGVAALLIFFYGACEEKWLTLLWYIPLAVLLFITIFLFKLSEN